MTGQRLDRMSWPYQQPINVPFDVNKDSEQWPGLVAWWPMIGGQGGWPVLDRASQLYPMTPFNTPTWMSDGERGWSVLFDDANEEFLQYSGGPVVSSAPLTYSCWYARDDTNNDAGVMCSTAEFSGGWILRVLANGQIRFSRAGALADTAAGGDDTEWHHACGIDYDGTNIAVFRDGMNKATDSGIGAPNPDRMCIGGQNWFAGVSFEMSGSVSDARIYNRALTDTEVFNLRTNPWELYKPRIPQQLAYVAPAAAAIMNQIQFGNLGADLFDGTLIQ